MGCRKWRLIVSFLSLMNLHSFLFVEAQNYYCFEEGGNYTQNSFYQTALQNYFSLVPSNMGYNGFFNFSAGPTDPMSGTALCRADLQLEDCRTCTQNATVEIINFCPFRRQAILWRENCTLRFSNESIYGVLAVTPVMVLRNPANVSSVQQFIDALSRLLDDLRVQAAAAGPLMKVAAGNRTGPDSQNIYSMAQCTPDISANDCDRCLSNAAQQIPLYGSRGLRVLLPSCTLRYETVPFFNLSRIQEAEALLGPPAPPLSPPSSPYRTVGGGSTTTIIIVVAAVAGCLVLAISVVFILRRKQMKKQKKAQETTTNDDGDEIRTVESLQYDLGKIRAATDDFSEANELGRGGFGVVYKGKLENGKEIAVKRLSGGSDQGDLEFKNEVLVMAKLQHRNLLKILGFTIEGTERLLIYEFLQNLSLDRFIFDPVKRSQMDWDKRYKIIAGIARGLLYLHEDSRFRIIHRDLKPSNVLLDSEMNPKIADFGLARLYDGIERSTCRVVGTHGYMAPEYASRGHLSVKIDVYSFGVVILEIMSGQKNRSFINGDRAEDMLSFGWRRWQEGTTENMIDPVLRTGSGSGSLRDMLRCIHIGLLCVQEKAGDRPTMASVVLMLNSSSITMPPPSRPAFFTPLSADFSERDIGRFREFEEVEPLVLNVDADSSRNDVSVSELFPR